MPSRSLRMDMVIVASSVEEDIGGGEMYFGFVCEVEKG